MSNNAKWLQLADSLLDPLMKLGLEVLSPSQSEELDLASKPFSALLHFGGCLTTSIEANKEGKHSVAICLLRQCVEAITLVDLGLQRPEFSRPLISDWRDGNATQGELRRILEKDVWPRYGHGLWDEPWADFFRSLSRAVQPYAHYSQELMGWQIHQWDDGGRLLATIGSYDPIKASRITLLHALLIWTLGRLLVEHEQNHRVLEWREAIAELGTSLASSKLLFLRRDWSTQLTPHVLFRAGADWRDP